jgi:hypothetical protein
MSTQNGSIAKKEWFERPENEFDFILGKITGRVVGNGSGNITCGHDYIP